MAPVIIALSSLLRSLRPLRITYVTSWFSLRLQSSGIYFKDYSRTLSYFLNPTVNKKDPRFPAIPAHLVHALLDRALEGVKATRGSRPLQADIATAESLWRRDGFWLERKCA